MDLSKKYDLVIKYSQTKKSKKKQKSFMKI